jgi:hypothetical protein
VSVRYLTDAPAPLRFGDGAASGRSASGAFRGRHRAEAQPVIIPGR